MKGHRANRKTSVRDVRDFAGALISQPLRGDEGGGALPQGTAVAARCICRSATNTVEHESGKTDQLRRSGHASAADFRCKAP